MGSTTILVWLRLTVTVIEDERNSEKGYSIVGYGSELRP